MGSLAFSGLYDLPFSACRALNALVVLGTRSSSSNVVDGCGEGEAFSTKRLLAAIALTAARDKFCVSNRIFQKRHIVSSI